MQRIRRRVVSKPRQEDTPLGRERLMGEALEVDDLDEIARIGHEPLPAYPAAEHSEEVFTVGGHQSLSRLVAAPAVCCTSYVIIMCSQKRSIPTWAKLSASNIALDSQPRQMNAMKFI